MTKDELLLAYYGDDFTGSTDALEFLSRAGIKTVLFIEPPTQEKLSRYTGVQAIGVAGSSRAMTPEEMERELVPAFIALNALNAIHVHYKVCSTFDSSPSIGSIGKAIDIGAEIFPAQFIPLLVAAPALGRYCIFGNLFARMGIGSKGNIYRLDRHPSMRKHPITPADESDLRLHLSRQTSKTIGLIDILQISQSFEEAQSVLNAQSSQIILIDGLYENQLETIGRLIDSCRSDGQSLFTVGSSGVEMALGKYWASGGGVEPAIHWPSLSRTDVILVVSGSRSPISAAQISWAVSRGFVEIGLDTATLISNENEQVEIENCTSKAIAAIQSGKSVIVHTSFGENDPRAEAVRLILKDRQLDRTNITARVFGEALGNIAKAVAADTGIKRIIVAGGDTSSFAARAMGIEAVEMIATLSPGAPLCRAYAPSSPIDGLEVNFKGGQVGREEYYEMALG